MRVVIFVSALLVAACSSESPPTAESTDAPASPAAAEPTAPDAQVASRDELGELRGAALAGNPAAPRMAVVENTDRRRPREYPMQPPTIPHAIDGYQVDANANRCMACHARSRTGESQAPMVSVTHFQDRDGNFLAEISPRRYFCNQCHVVQTDARPLVGNTFEDYYQVAGQGGGEGR